MEVKNDIVMKFNELKMYVKAVEINHFYDIKYSLLYSHINQELERLIKQVEDCFDLDNGE